MRFKRSVIAFLSACVILLSSCNDSGGNVTVTDDTYIAPDIGAAEGTEDPGEDTDDGDIAPEITETEPEDTAGDTPDAPGNETDDTPDIPDDDTDPDDGVPHISEADAADGASHTAATTGKKTDAPPAATTTAAPPATTSATTAATTAKPPAQVVIPKIKMPESPGTKTITGTNTEVDYSNAAEGYISVLYSGSADGGKVRLKCGNVQYDHDLAAGKREYFPLMDSGSYSVKVYEHVSGANYAQLIDDSFDVTLRSTTEMYLYPNKYITFSSSSSCVKKAAELCAGETDDVEKIAQIFTYLADNIVYDKQLAATVQSGYVPDPDSTLSSKKGICFDYASLFAAMCRSQGIPARLVIGYASPDIYHAWNEIYTDETGWITPELFFKKKGYNIADATFYASNPDKEKIAAYISNDGNYTAMYRY
ncbi:MAG: transglutaminase domain-containing protein [Oscillospiraceae bacterium]|nr:transglutaminase domain-containing protein [Oscillospiraceae bacterium]